MSTLSLFSFSEPEPRAETTSLGIVAPEPEAEPETYGNLSGLTPEGEPEAMTLNDPHVMRIMSAVSGLMAVAIILENIIVLFVMCRQWPKQNPHITYFVMHLAIADLVSGFQFLWFNCIDVQVQLTRQGYWILALCGLWMVSIAASVGGILNFASLRIHALKNAMKNEKYSKKRAILTIAFSWLFPFVVLFLPPMFGWNCVNATAEQLIGGECSQVVFPFTKAYVLLLVCLLMFSIVWLAAFYVRIYVLVHRRLRSVKGLAAKSKGKETERQLFVTMMIIMLLFFICHFPLCVVLTIDFAIKKQSAALVDAFQIILITSFVNAILNPVIYYWRMPATRDAFWLAFGARERTQIGRQFSKTASRIPDRTENTISSKSEYTSQKPELPGTVRV